MKKINIVLLLCFSMFGSILFAENPDSALVAKYKADMRNRDYISIELHNGKELIAFAKALEKNRSIDDLTLEFGLSLNEEMAEALKNALKKNHTLKILLIDLGSFSGNTANNAKILLPALLEALKVNRTITQVFFGEEVNPELKEKIMAELEINEKIGDFLKKSPEMWEKAKLLLQASGYPGDPASAFHKVPKGVALHILNLAAKSALKDLLKQ